MMIYWEKSKIFHVGGTVGTRFAHGLPKKDADFTLNALSSTKKEFTG